MNRGQELCRRVLEKLRNGTLRICSRAALKSALPGVSGEEVRRVQSKLRGAELITHEAQPIADLQQRLRRESLASLERLAHRLADAPEIEVKLLPNITPEEKPAPVVVGHHQGRDIEQKHQSPDRHQNGCRLCGDHDGLVEKYRLCGYHARRYYRRRQFAGLHGHKVFWEVERPVFERWLTDEAYASLADGGSDALP